MKKQLKSKGLCLAAALLIALGSFGCAGSGQPGSGNTFDPSQVEKTINTIQTVEKSISWIMPLAGGVVAIFAPEALPAYRMAVASYHALIAVTDNAIAAYRGNPTEESAAKLTDVLAQLQEAWAVLDGAYKADPSAIAKLKPAAE